MLKFSALPNGTRLLGMAPIGVQWEAEKTARGKLKPDGNCPPGEFCITHALVNGEWVECEHG